LFLRRSSARILPRHGGASVSVNVSKFPAEDELTVSGSISWLKVAVTAVPATTACAPGAQGLESKAISSVPRCRWGPSR
jgi:hypothetical protein